MFHQNNRIKKGTIAKLIGLTLSIGFFFQLSHPTASTIKENGDFRLTAENKWDTASEKNYAALNWDKVANLTTNGYTLYQSKDSGLTWTTVSMNYQKQIKVLNIHPDDVNFDNLKKWMEMDTPAAGMGLINVSSVSVAAFNANPNLYLKNASGAYQYDVIMFGSKDWYGFKDLSMTSAAALQGHVDSGRGVLFGHDTVTGMSTPSNPGGGSHPNFNTFAPQLGIQLSNKTSVGSTKVRVDNNGYMMKYPHQLANSVELTIPLAHSWGQIIDTTSTTTKWLSFIPPYAFGSLSESGTLTNNFYLITKGNLGMIQTGHSGGASTPDERRIIANTLYNLAQVSLDNFASDYTVKDEVAPPKPTLTLKTGGTIENQIFDIGAIDKGSMYQWYVEADTKSGKKKSDTVEEEIVSGTKGFIHIVDNQPNTLVAAEKDSFGKVTNLTLQGTDATLSFNGLTDGEKWLHIRAVDRADNIGEIRHIQVKDFLGIFRITEKYEDEAGQTLAPSTYQDVNRGATYEKLGPLLPHNWLQIGYRLNQTNFKETTAKITAVDKVNTVTFIYRKLPAKIHLRQVILDKKDDLVIPTNGYFQLLHHDTTMNLQTQSGASTTVPFNTIQSEMQVGNYQFTIQSIVPEHYSYDGYLISSEQATIHDEKNRIQTGYPQLDFTVEKEYWVSIYLKPINANEVRSYSWNYQTNPLGKLIP
ncbi:DUF5057 domain-containing protein [Isobaculum melis]|uniref:MucBP domain-containing protein n=1 Tax=Isobaculum melis TaxID=142588 RepID=A0A1H9S1R9_9LACT|nr:DUF5057 domain-containing protein [Isobaculum melis]SER78996.1 protein of unknown function [Isobaculum melis]